MIYIESGWRWRYEAGASNESRVFDFQKSPTKGKGCGNNGRSETLFGGSGSREAGARCRPESISRPTPGPRLQRVVGLSHADTLRPHQSRLRHHLRVLHTHGMSRHDWARLKVLLHKCCNSTRLLLDLSPPFLLLSSSFPPPFLLLPHEITDQYFPNFIVAARQIRFQGNRMQTRQIIQLTFISFSSSSFFFLFFFGCFLTRLLPATSSTHAKGID
jgi:hypothetical protein